MAPHQQGSSRMSRSNTPVQEGGDLTVPIAIALLFVFGLATLVVIKGPPGMVGWPGASQPPAPTDPYVTVSRHTALVALII
jgi:hypothetical protein